MLRIVSNASYYIRSTKVLSKRLLVCSMKPNIELIIIRVSKVVIRNAKNYSLVFWYFFCVILYYTGIIYQILLSFLSIEGDDKPLYCISWVKKLFFKWQWFDFNYLTIRVQTEARWMSHVILSLTLFDFSLLFDWLTLIGWSERKL